MTLILTIQTIAETESAPSGELYFDLESTEWSIATTNDITTDIPATFSTVPQTTSPQSMMTSSINTNTAGTVETTGSAQTLGTTDYQTESTEINFSTQSIMMTSSLDVTTEEHVTSTYTSGYTDVTVTQNVTDVTQNVNTLEGSLI